MVDPLAPLLHDGIIEAVISRLKTGKEAEIFLVQQQGEIYAAKVYKERNARNFRNNAAYKEGRVSRNSRTQRAMEKGSRFGQRAAEEAWKAKELEALQKLHAAGVRVPQPMMLYEGVLLMEIVIDAQGHPAPRLIDAQIPVEQAAALYADLRQQAIRMLACDLIHGDLSPYNVLLAWNGPTVIDFPQVVGAAQNSQAERFFRRDLETIHRFFAAIDPRLRANAQDAREIWAAYQRRELTADFVPTGRFEAPRGAAPHGPGQRQSGPRQHGERPRHQGGPRHGQPGHGAKHPGGERRDPAAPQHRGQPHQGHGGRTGAPAHQSHHGQGGNAGSPAQQPHHGHRGSAGAPAQQPHHGQGGSSGSSAQLPHHGQRGSAGSTPQQSHQGHRSHAGFPAQTPRDQRSHQGETRQASGAPHPQRGQHPHTGRAPSAPPGGQPGASTRGHSGRPGPGGSGGRPPGRGGKRPSQPVVSYVSRPAPSGDKR